MQPGARRRRREAGRSCSFQVDRDQSRPWDSRLVEARIDDDDDRRFDQFDQFDHR